VEDGLPVNHANALHQTPDGYIWLATFDGLVRFDGLRFTVYNASNTPALPSSRIGTIRPGLGASFWITTVQGHLLRWTSGARSETFDVRADPLYATYVDGDSLTWLAGRRGLFRYRAGHVTAAFEDQLDSRWITDIRRDRNGTLWVADRSGGTWRAEEGRLTPATPPAGLSLTTSSSAYYRQRRASRCPDGTWVRGGGTTIEWEGRPIPVAGGGLTGLLCDQAGNLWVTTRRSGLHRYGRPPLRSYGEREGLGLRNVYSVYEDPAGARWFTGRGGRISRLHDGVIRHYVEGTHFAESMGPVAHDSDQAMIEDQDGRLWLGFQVCRPADRTAEGRCTRFDWAAGAPQKNGVYAIHQTTDGALWFGTTHGLYRLHGDEWSRFTTADGLADDHVRFLLEAQDGRLYAATLRGGVLRYQDGTFTAITAADGLPSNHVRALHEDDDGFLWIGTEDRGLGRYDPATGALATIRQADGLYYDGIHQILEDDAGQLWMSTNRGLFWVRRVDLNAFIRGTAEQVTSVHYTERDGMRNREANGGRQQSALKATDGRLWFATQAGAVVVDPADVPRDTPSPQPIIEQVTAGGASVAMPQAGGSLDLAAEDRSFTVAYTAPATDFLPILLLTARATDADKIQGLSDGADAYLTKPFNMRELQARVENLIAARQRLKARFAATPVDEVSCAFDGTADLAPSEAAYVERVRAAVEANLSDEAFGVEELAAALDQSRSTLYRRLRDMVDQSPSAYIRAVRLEQGAALLRGDEGTVSEVAYAVGFKSVSHFSQTFRDRYGVTPSEYSDAVLQ
jgi:ligand-binding sensor domain-containing protein/AraC-like DNA-binding protein